MCAELSPQVSVARSSPKPPQPRSCLLSNMSVQKEFLGHLFSRGGSKSGRPFRSVSPTMAGRPQKRSANGGSQAGSLNAGSGRRRSPAVLLGAAALPRFPVARDAHQPHRGFALAHELEHHARVRSHTDLMIIAGALLDGRHLSGQPGARHR